MTHWIESPLSMFVLLSILSVPGIARGSCAWNGNTGTAAAPFAAADVQECVDEAAAKSGEVVILIPACRVTWSATVSVDMTSWTQVTSVTIQGAGRTATDITADGAWDVMTKTDKKFRLTGMTIRAVGPAQASAAVVIKGDTRPSLGGGFRIDNLVFNRTTDSGNSQRALSIWGPTYGVIDSIWSDWYGQFSIVYSLAANATWAADDSFGTSDAVYLENTRAFNTRESSQGMLMDHWDGARIVVRYCLFSGYYFGGHDTLFNVDDPARNGFRAARQWEFYNNELRTSTAWGSSLVGLRGGTGYVFNNQLVSSVDVPFYDISGIILTNYRSWSKRDSWCDNQDEKMCVIGSVKGCDQDSDCDGLSSGSCQPIDGNIDGTGYPCRDQIGRGKDQTSRPALFWNNALIVNNASPVPVDAMVTDNCIADGEFPCNPLCIQSQNKRWMAEHHIVEDRDYCNGATKPGACNGVETKYEAYTCPHPLVGTGTCDPSATGPDGYHGAAPLIEPTYPTLPSGSGGCNSSPGPVRLGSAIWWTLIMAFGALAIRIHRRTRHVRDRRVT